jgi:protein-L-isoaspartate(D-aspartate) O-methyltransferase
MDKGQLIALLKHQGFPDRIIDAFDKVRREDFITDNFKKLAYEDIALPISESETISQPSTIATALSLLKVRENMKVLEIGSGCGYVLALLSEIVGEKGRVYGIEIMQNLAERSIKHLRNYKNIKVYNRNGKIRMEEAPFTRIIISAALEEVPIEILEELEEGGILVAPIGPGFMQTLTQIRRMNKRFIVEKEIPGFIFVKFVN